jgi:hypothetical protein
MAFGLDHWIKEHNIPKNDKPEIFVGGTGIIFSVDMIKQFLSKKNYLKKEVLDDSAIGLVMYEHFPEVELKNLGSIKENSYIWVPPYEENKNIVELIKPEQNIFYRIKNEDKREYDYLSMEKIIEII